MKNLLQDLRFALRQMRRSPGFALTAVLTLALGIAANVIVFCILQTFILQPIDVPHAQQVVTLARIDQTYPIFSVPEVNDVGKANTVFSGLAPYTIASFGLEANGVSRPIWGSEVGGQYFELLGVQPLLGRLLSRADDEHPGASAVAVLTWPTWNDRFGSDPDIVGKTVRINKIPYTIVGVTPQGFYGTEKIAEPGLFLPLANEASLSGFDFLNARSAHTVWAIARLKAGMTRPQAEAQLKTIAAGIARQYPHEEETLGLKLTRPGLMGDFLGAPVRGFLYGLMGLAGIVLLAACANLGSLFAARTADRAREIAIRMAIGSSRWRIVRQILVEALVISLVGGACASALAWLALTGLGNWHPPTDYPLRFHLQPQPSMLAISLLISLCAGAVCGVMPLRQIFQADASEAIKSGSGQSYGGRRWALRDVLLAVQIALCCVTVTAAFVGLRGLGKALTMNLGFNPEHAVVTKFVLNQAGYTDAGADHVQRQLLERVVRLPGVEAAAYASATPLSQDTSTFPVYTQQAVDLRPSSTAFYCYDYRVSPGYFAAAQTPLLEGREVSFADTPTTPAVAVVNQQFARQLFHTEHAVGRFFKDGKGTLIQIVGIAGDGRYLTLTEDPDEAAFFPISQRPSNKTSLIVRTQANGSGMMVNDTAAMVRKAIRDQDPGIPIEEASPWKNQLGLTFFVSQVATVALGIFGAFGLLLSIAGTFGLASYTVSKRMRELSIRVALGAQAKEVLQAALGRMLLLIAAGSIVGMVLGAAASRLLAAIVYQATARDPYVLAAVAFTMLLTGSLSVVGPVRRALAADPASLLREQ